MKYYLTLASNCCQNLSPEEFVHVADALSILSSRLVHEDKKSAETACLALSRLGMFSNSKMSIITIFRHKHFQQKFALKFSKTSKAS